MVDSIAYDDTYTSIVAYFVGKVNIENSRNAVLVSAPEMLMLEKRGISAIMSNTNWSKNGK